MDDAKPNTLPISEADLATGLRTGDPDVTVRLRAAIEAGDSIRLDLESGSPIYISTAVALEAQLQRIQEKTEPHGAR
jgi:hypothetical protein